MLRASSIFVLVAIVINPITLAASAMRFTPDASPEADGTLIAGLEYQEILVTSNGSAYNFPATIDSVIPMPNPTVMTEIIEGLGGQLIAADRPRNSVVASSSPVP